MELIMKSQPKSNKTKRKELIKSGTTNTNTDVVMTPRPLAKAIINHLPISGKVMDPCLGTGAFFDQFPVSASKIYCEIEEGLNFYECNERVDWIVSNPPWSHYRPFAKHAYTLADNVAFLITNNHDIGLKARIRDMEEAGFGIREIIMVDTPKENWPQSGFQLGVCWKQKGYTGDVKMTRLSW